MNREETSEKDKILNEDGTDKDEGRKGRQEEVDNNEDVTRIDMSMVSPTCPSYFLVFASNDCNSRGWLREGERCPT